MCRLPTQDRTPCSDEDHVDIMAEAHGMGQQEAVAAIAGWLDLRATHRPGAARAEDLAVADLLRSGDWLKELEELSRCT